jgi:hypothetical protein
MRKGLLLIALSILTILELIPFPTTVVTKWSVRLVDQNGMPIVRTDVEQTCDHDTYFTDWNICGESVDARQKTDQNGVVEFSEKRIWLSLVSRRLRGLTHHFLRLFHGSVGISATLFVHSEFNLEPSVINQNSGPPQDGLIVLKRKD